MAKEVFKIAHADCFKMVDGEKLDVKAFDKWEFFTHYEEEMSEWVISELSSGFAIRTGKTKKRAIFQLKELLKRVSEPDFKYRIEKAIEHTKNFNVVEF